VVCSLLEKMARRMPKTFAIELRDGEIAELQNGLPGRCPNSCPIPSVSMGRKAAEGRASRLRRYTAARGV
jgi:hypothetical protein